MNFYYPSFDMVTGSFVTKLFIPYLNPRSMASFHYFLQLYFVLFKKIE